MYILGTVRLTVLNALVGDTLGVGITLVYV